MCEAKPRRFLSFAPRRPGAGYIALSRRRGSAMYTGHPLGHRSTWPACFQAGSLRRWRPPTFLFTSPSLKEDGENPQSRPSHIFWPACLPQAELANSTRPNTIFSTRTGMPWFIRGQFIITFVRNILIYMRLFTIYILTLSLYMINNTYKYIYITNEGNSYYLCPYFLDHKIK